MTHLTNALEQAVVRGTAALANESERKGWIMGPFITPITSVEFDGTHEVKLWHYDTTPEYGVKGFHGNELIVIYGGRLRLKVFFSDGVEHEYVLEGKSHDYIILPPHRKEVIPEECPAFGVTVRYKI
jgi:hypothetical protein